MKTIIKIAELREQAGLTQLELSQEINVTDTTIANWEKGRSGIEGIERVVKLCSALKCRPEDLIHYENNKLNLSVPTDQQTSIEELRKELGTSDESVDQPPSIEELRKESDNLELSSSRARAKCKEAG